MKDSFTVKVKRFKPTDPRLGRHVRHDSRSLNYRVKPVFDVNTLKSVRHERFIPVLDQGRLGSCTGNAAAGCIGSGFFWAESLIEQVLSATDAQSDETYAVGIYSEATALDDYQGTYPPHDTGSDGLSVAKVLQKRGLISGYLHATSFEALLTALAQQPVIVGTEWRSNMFSPEPDGKMHISGTVAGGHEYVLDELDMENHRVWMTNSWGSGWGVDGRAYFTFTDFASLLSAEGDCTVFVPMSEPAPIPPSPPDDNKSELQKLFEELKDILDRIGRWFIGNEA